MHKVLRAQPNPFHFQKLDKAFQLLIWLHSHDRYPEIKRSAQLNFNLISKCKSITDEINSKELSFWKVILFFVLSPSLPSISKLSFYKQTWPHLDIQCSAFNFWCTLLDDERNAIRNTFSSLSKFHSEQVKPSMKFFVSTLNS